MRLSFALLLAFSSLSAPVFAQSAPHAEPPVNPVSTPIPPAKEADVATLDGIVAALYDVISGPAGQARDWNRMRSLFVPGARMMPVGGKPKDAIGIRLLTVNDYVATSGPLLVEKGFQERELARRTEQFGNIAQVFTTYEAKIGKDEVTMRGINSLQLMNDGKRWWIVSVMWQAETAEVPLPKHYVSGSR